MNSWQGSPGSTNGATVVQPKAITTIASGAVRRHRSVDSSASATTTQPTRQGRSGRKIPSTTIAGARAAISAQSRHVRDGAGETRGSVNTACRRGCMALIVRTVVRLQIVPKYDPGGRSLGGRARLRELELGADGGGVRMVEGREDVQCPLPVGPAG